MAITFFVSLFFLVIGQVFGTFDDIGGDKATETTEKDIYICYRMMHCELGDEVYQMAEECHEQLTDEDWELMWQWYSEAGFPEFANKNADELTKLMCPMKEEDKEDLFNKISGKLTTGLSKECTRNSMGHKCKHGNEVMQCFGDKINQLKMERKCGFDIDNMEKKK